MCLWVFILNSTSASDITNIKPEPATQYAVFPWIMGFLKPHKLKVVAAITFLFIGSFAWLSLGQGVKMMVDEGFVADNAERLNEIVLFILGITAISGTAVFVVFI